MTDYHFRIGETDDAKELVSQFHYSRRWAGSVHLVGTLHADGGLFGTAGPCVAACVWTIPPTRWREPVLELSRLVRGDVPVPLSQLVAKCCDHLRRERRWDLLVSYADWTHEHHGGIYQACSWNYNGQRKENRDGLIVNGEFIPGRMCNNMYGTSSPTRLAERLPNASIVPHFDHGKHLYWRALNKNGQRKAGRLNLKSVPYPKPDTVTP